MEASRTPDRGDYVRRGALWVPCPDDYGIRGHRRAVASWALHDLVWHLPTIQYRSENLPADFWPRHSSFAKSSAHVRFGCAELVRHAVLWATSFEMNDGRTLQTPPRSPPQLGRDISNALAVRLEVEEADPGVLGRDGVHAFLYATMSPQWEFMRSHAFRAVQATWMFHDALAEREKRSGDFPRFGRLRSVIERSLGMTVPEFVSCVAMLYARAVSPTPQMNAGNLYVSPMILSRVAPWMAGSDGANRFHSARLAHVFAMLAASQSELKAALLADGRTAGDEAVLRCPNPLQRRPIVLPFSNSRGLGLAPVPHLLLEFLYEPLTDLLYSESKAAGLVGEFNQLFEEYVGLLLQLHSPPTIRWHQERVLQPQRGKVVDWAAEFRSHLILVDAKRAWLEPAVRHRLRAGDWSSFQSALLRGVVQGAEFWRCVRDGRVPAFRGAMRKRPVLVLAVGSDASVVPYPEAFRRQLLEAAHRAAPRLHVVVTWPDQLHALLSTWQRRDVDWLPETLSRSRRLDGEPLDTQLDYRTCGPLWRAFASPIRAARDSADSPS